MLVNSVLAVSDPKGSMENIDLTMFQNIEFEEKVKQEPLDNQILPPKRIKSENIKNFDIKQEPLDNQIEPSKRIKFENFEIHDIKQEPLEEENYHAAFESDLDVGREFKLKMEGDILKLFEELDNEKSENSPMDFSHRKSLKIRQIVENYAQLGLIRYPISRNDKTKIVEITEEHKIDMTLKNIALTNELQSTKVINQELRQKIKDLEMNKNTFGTNDSLERNVEIKTFSCKSCDKSSPKVLDNSQHKLNRVPTYPKYIPTRLAKRPRVDVNK